MSATTTKNNDQTINALLKKIEEQTAALGKPIKPAWNTNGVFKFGAGEALNINVTNETEKLCYALAELFEHEASFVRASGILGLKKAVYKYNGYTVDEWKEDFMTRIRVIEYNAKKKTLDATKAKLQGMVSEEAKTEAELAAIADLLG